MRSVWILLLHLGKKPQSIFHLGGQQSQSITQSVKTDDIALDCQSIQYSECPDTQQETLLNPWQASSRGLSA